jgi:hypothetical protein
MFAKVFCARAGTRWATWTWPINNVVLTKSVLDTPTTLI